MKDDNKINKRYHIKNEERKIFEEYFTIKEICLGFISLKCKIHSYPNEVKIGQLKFYLDCPRCLCYKCNQGKSYRYQKIKKHAEKYGFTLNDTRKDFIENKSLNFICKNDHKQLIKDEFIRISEKDKLPKFCQKCYDDEEITYYVKKRITSDKTKKKLIKKEKNVFYIYVTNYSKKQINEGLNKLPIDKSLVICLDDFTQYKNFESILENSKFKYLKEDSILSLTFNPEYLQDSLKKNIPKKPKKLKNPVESCVQHIDNNFKEGEIEQIHTEPIDNIVDIYPIFDNDKIMNIVNNHNNFMNNYYPNLKRSTEIIDQEYYCEDYIIFDKARQDKYYEFNPIVHNYTCYRNKYSCHNIGEKNNNHNFIDKIKTFKTELDYIETASPFVKLFDTSFTSDCLLLKKNLKINELRNVNEVAETKKEKNLALKTIDLLTELYNMINQFYKNNNKDINIMPLVKKIQKCKDIDIGITSTVFIDVLSSKTNFTDKVEIDPVLVNTIIFANNNSEKNPFFSYFYGSKQIKNDDVNLYLDLNMDNNLLVLTKHAEQKILFIDSGVAELYCKILMKNLHKTNLDMLIDSEISRICPEEMFKTENDSSNIGLRIDNITEYKIIDVIDCRLNFSEFLGKLTKSDLINGKNSDYSTRYLLCKHLMALSSTGIFNNIPFRKMEDYIKYHMLHEIILNKKEIEMKNTLHPRLFSVLLRSEIKNVLNYLIEDLSKTKAIGTILHPKIKKLYYKDEEIPEFVPIEWAFK